MGVKFPIWKNPFYLSSKLKVIIGHLDGFQDIKMDVNVVNRPLYRSASMSDRRTTNKITRTIGNDLDKTHSQSLDRALRNNFIAAFDEYIYYENGFRRFRGVSSLLAQNVIDKDLDELSSSEINMDGKTGNDINGCNNYNGDSGSGMGINKDVDASCRSSDCFDTCVDRELNASSIENPEEMENDKPKHKPNKPVVRRWSLYDRERKPHYCTHHVPPEPKTRPSAWSYGGKKSEHSDAWTKRKRSQTEVRDYTNGDIKSSSNDLLEVTPRKVSQSRSISSASSDFDLDGPITCNGTSNTGCNSGDTPNIDKMTLADFNAYSAFKLENKQSPVRRSSQIPRPVRTLSFCSTTSEVTSDHISNDPEDIFPRIGLRRSASMIERRGMNVYYTSKSVPTTPTVNGPLEGRVSDTYRGITSMTSIRSVEKSNSAVLLEKKEKHSIYVAEEEDDYPEPSPSSRAKSDIFHSRDFIKIDQHSLAAPETLLDNFDQLIEYLVGDLTNDMSKLRSIYRWTVAQHLPLNVRPGEISRDSPMWFFYNIREKRVSFSELFAVLCRRADIPCVIIHGVAKSVAYDVGDKVTQKRLKNSWNAVYVEGEWRFVHPYWARQSVRGYDTGRWAVVECDEFHTDENVDSKQMVSQKINDFFFLTDPDKFITKCFPEDPSWQLLPKPLTKSEFEDLPFLQPAFYMLNLQVRSHTSCVIHTDTGRVELTLGLPPEMSKRYNFLYKLFIHRDWEAEGEYDQILLDRYLLHYVQDDIAMFEIRFPVNGVYKLEIHCRDRNRPLPTDWVCDYRIVCYEAMPNCDPLPVVPSIGWGLGPELENSGLECLTHSNALVNLDHETVTFFRFALPKDKSVNVEADLLKIDMSREELSNHVTMEQDSEHALVQISPPIEGEYALQIFMLEEGENKRTNVCNFLMHRTQIVEDPELADIRNELIKATDGSDVEALSHWIERFVDKQMEDRGDLTRARKKLHLAKLNRDLKEAISRKDLDFLERVLHSASDTSMKKQLGHLAEEAEVVRSRLRRLKRLQHAVLDLDQKTISEMRSYPKPPPAVHGVMAATYLLLGNKESDVKKWSKIQSLITKRGKDSLKRRVAEFNINNVSLEVLTRVRSILSRYDLETVQIASIGAATFYQWAFTMAGEATDV